MYYDLVFRYFKCRGQERKNQGLPLVSGVYMPLTVAEFCDRIHRFQGEVKCRGCTVKRIQLLLGTVRSLAKIALVDKQGTRIILQDQTLTLGQNIVFRYRGGWSRLPIHGDGICCLDGTPLGSGQHGYPALDKITGVADDLVTQVARNLFGGRIIHAFYHTAVTGRWYQWSGIHHAFDSGIYTIARSTGGFFRDIQRRCWFTEQLPVLGGLDGHCRQFISSEHPVNVAGLHDPGIADRLAATRNQAVTGHTVTGRLTQQPGAFIK